MTTVRLSPFTRLVILFTAIFATASLTMRCGKDDSGESTASGTYSNVFSGTFERGSGSGLTEGEYVVNFTISWNEENGNITGFYGDDYFAASQVAVTGSIQDGKRIMSIMFKQERDGIKELVIMTAATNGEIQGNLTIESLSALSSKSNVVFERNGIVMTKDASGKASGDSATFFSEVAGDYEFFAKNTNAVGNKTDWTHGTKYKISITAGGVVTIPTDGEAKTFTFGSNTEDKYEKYDHEDYVVFAVGEGVKVLVQRQNDPKNFFITWHKEGAGFWSFQEADAGPTPNVLSVVGLGYVVGTHKYKITFISGEGATDYKKDDPVEVAVAEDGSVTGTFGEYKYVQNDTSVGNSTVNGKATGSVTFYRPDQKTFPRWSLLLRFEEEKFVQATATYEPQTGSNLGRKAYNAVVGK